MKTHLNPEILNVSVDGLIVAFMGCISQRSLEQFAAAKQDAEEQGGESYSSISGLAGHVKSNGAKGGYRYIFNQGPLAAKWQVKHSTDVNQWNLLAKMPSGALLEYGLKACITMLEDDLEALGGRIQENSVSRFDICADMICEGFEIEPEMITAHSATSGKRHADLSYEDYLKFMESNGQTISGLQKVETLTVGSITNRQFTIYNKRKQAIKMQLSHWFDIWGRDKTDKTPIWRVEMRAASKHLRDWNIKSLQDLLRRAGDMVAQGFDDVRYLSEKKSNITRSKNHPLWETAKKSIVRFLQFARTCEPRGRIIKCIKAQKIKVIKTMIVGLSSTLLALDIKGERSVEVLEYESLFDRLRRLVGSSLERAIEYEPLEIKKKMRHAHKKYHFIESPDYAR